MNRTFYGKKNVRRIVKKPDTKTEMMLKELVESGKQQQLRPVPEVPDVPRIRLKRNKVYTFEISTNRANFTTSTSIETDTSYYFQLSDLNISTNFTSIFDTYRIAQVNLKFIPLGTSSGAMINSAIYTALDYDDASATTIASLLNYETLQITDAEHFFERTVNPKPAFALYGGAFTQFGQISQPWVDCGSPSVYHYGVKVAAPVTAAAAITFQVVGTYLVQFKNTR